MSAVALATASGLTDRGLDSLFHKDKPVVSHSEGEAVNQCGTQLFVPAPRSEQLASGQLPSEPDWEAFRRQTEASVVSPDVVEVSIQGESERTITLTGIDFDVERRSRPPGAIFTAPCGGPAEGRFIQVDLDRGPVAITRSAEVKGEFGRGLPPGQAPAKPIEFPWTVSVQDPLLLNIVATTRRCYCIWRASVRWRSGGKSGALEIDNSGKGYAAVGPEDAKEFVQGSASPSGWRPNKQ